MKYKMKIILLLILFVSGTFIFTEMYNFNKIIGFYLSNSNVKFYYDNYGEKISFQSDGLTIVGTLYGERSDEDKTIRPGVVLVHGETPMGRKLPVYRILSKELVERGYVVLTFDRRGIGESDNPEQVNMVESWDESNDVIQAVSYLYNLKNIDKSKIYVIGHSGGSVPVMQASLDDNRIKKSVIIGPPRRIEERILNENANTNDLETLWKRRSEDRELKEPINLVTFLSIVSELKKLYDEYKIRDHIPIFLIDGEVESYEDKLYLSNYFIELKEPKKYYTINNSDHYLNTTSIGNFMMYNGKVNNDTINSLDNWFNS